MGTRKLPLPLLLAAAAALLLSPGVAGQGPESTTPYRFRVPVNLVLLNVRVSARDQEMPPPLERDDFTVLEDGKPQSIRVFENPRQQARVVLVLDVSGSTRNKIEQIQRATQEFLNELAEQDEVAVITVGPTFDLIQDFTADARQLQKVATRIRSQVGRGTQLYDGLAAALQLVERQPNRSMVVVFSDGMDTHSEISYDRLRQEVLRGASGVYVVSLDTLREEMQRLEEQLRRVSMPKKLVLVLDLASSSAETRRAIAKAAQIFLEELQPLDRVGLLQYRANQLWLLAERDSPPQADRRLNKLGAASRGRLVPRRDAAAVGGATLLHQGKGENIIVLTDESRSGVLALESYLPLERAAVFPVAPEDKLVDLRQEMRKMIHSRVGVERNVVKDLEALPAFFAQSQKRLQQLARESGGRYFLLEDINRLHEAYAIIVQELKDTYLLGYYSKAGPGFHPLDVRLKQERLRARTRRGFFAPFEPD